MVRYIHFDLFIVFVTIVWYGSLVLGLRPALVRWAQRNSGGSLRR